MGAYNKRVGGIVLLASDATFFMMIKKNCIPTSRTLLESPLKSVCVCRCEGRKVTGKEIIHQPTVRHTSQSICF